jgi:PadR family transcriptional regulator AphA
MTIENAILGLLSWRPLSGYDLKKIFEDSPILYWSGNNNEIYRTLVRLHQAGLVTREVQPQENLPARKIYSLTPQGHSVLQRWAAETPELPQLRHSLLIQLAWGDLLEKDELGSLLAVYDEEVAIQLRMSREQANDRSAANHQATFLNPRHARSPREALLWRSIQNYWIQYYETELAWIRQLRLELGKQEVQHDPH